MVTKEIRHESPKRKHERHPAREAIEAYAGDEADELPIDGYATMIAVFMGSFVGLIAAARKADVLPKRVPFRDIVLLGVATHKLTRIVTRERVTIPLRVPFTQYQGRDGAGQVRHHPRGHGNPRAIGSLGKCQYCAVPRVATGPAAGLLCAPRATRLACSMFAIVAISDFLHQVYAGARRWSR
jgi:hypothetical protein